MSDVILKLSDKEHSAVLAALHNYLATGYVETEHLKSPLDTINVVGFEDLCKRIDRASDRIYVLQDHRAYGDRDTMVALTEAAVDKLRIKRPWAYEKIVLRVEDIV